jgi:hypothetical protein
MGYEEYDLLSFNAIYSSGRARRVGRKYGLHIQLVACFGMFLACLNFSILNMEAVHFFRNVGQFPKYTAL